MSLTELFIYGTLVVLATCLLLGTVFIGFGLWIAFNLVLEKLQTYYHNLKRKMS